MRFKIAVITDIHDAATCPLPERRGEFGQVFLLRTVHRLNRMILPDAVVLLGDLINFPDGEDGKDRLRELRRIIDLIEAPTIVIPGNHDPDPDEFYTIFDRPDDVVDIGHVRFLPFVDPEQPGFNAIRKPEDMARMRKARVGHKGPVVTLQHVPVLPPGKTACRYGYTNIDEIIEVMDEQSITLAIGGHDHRGTPLVRHGRSAYFCAPALCEAPFVFTVIEIDDDDIQIQPNALQLSPELNLVDYHSHTQFAYCSENMHMATSSALAEVFGLSRLAFTEHSGHLYFDRRTYSSADFCKDGIASTIGRQNRIEDYWHEADHFKKDNVLVGLEVDADYAGYPVLKPEDRQKADILVGAVHFLPEMRKTRRDPDRMADEFMRVLEKFVYQGMHILAHPFRVFRRAKLPPPTHLYDGTARLLKDANMAAEINFHTNEPDPEFFRLCIDLGVKLTFGSDAHNLYEVGEFALHLEFLKACGYKGHVSDIIADFTTT